MAIDAYVGKPGSGKSYSVVAYVIIPSLQQGRHVVTNIPLNIDLLKEAYPNGEVTQLPDDWFSVPTIADFVPNGCVLVLDELWRRWPQGMRANQAHLQDKALLAEHRHRVDDKGNSMRIVLVTQDLSQVASFARTLIETTYRVRSIKRNKLFTTFIYDGFVTGDSPPTSKLNRQTSPTRYNKDIFKFYSSATQSESGNVGNESTADRRNSIFKSITLWIFIVIFVGGFFVAYYFITGFFDQSKEVVNVPASPALSSGVALKPAFKSSNDWRLSGFIHKASPHSKGKSLAVVFNKFGQAKYISFNHCQYDEDFLSVSCLVDNEKIDFYTGSVPRGIMGAFMGDTGQRSATSSRP